MTRDLRFLNSYQDDTSDLSKRVETSKEPIKDIQTIKDPITDDTHLVDGVRYLQYVPTNMDLVPTGVGIIGQGGPHTISGGGISQSIIQRGGGGDNSQQRHHVLMNSKDITLKSNSFAFNPLKAQTLVIAPLMEPFLTSDMDV